MKKINSIALLCFAGSLSVSAVAAEDPCFSVGGSQWSGRYRLNAYSENTYLGQCFWNDSATVSSFFSAITIVNNLTPVGCTFPSSITPATITFNGQCVNAQLTLKGGILGTVGMNTLSLNGQPLASLMVSLTRSPAQAASVFHPVSYKKASEELACKKGDAGYECYFR